MLPHPQMRVVSHCMPRMEFIFTTHGKKVPISTNPCSCTTNGALFSSTWSLRLFWLSLFTVRYKVKLYLNKAIMERYLSHAEHHGNVWTCTASETSIKVFISARVNLITCLLTNTNIQRLLESPLQTFLLFFYMAKPSHSSCLASKVKNTTLSIMPTLGLFCM